jgi:hypothetical protein
LGLCCFESEVNLSAVFLGEGERRNGEREEDGMERRCL